MGVHHRHVPADRLGSGGMKHCHGPCEQGRKPCPTPDACELQEPVCTDGLELLGIASIAVALLALMVVLLAICL